jgi:hypothetical protein
MKRVFYRSSSKCRNFSHHANRKDIAKIKADLEELGQIGLTVGGIFTDAFGGLSEALLNGQNNVNQYNY